LIAGIQDYSYYCRRRSHYSDRSFFLVLTKEVVLASIAVPFMMRTPTYKSAIVRGVPDSFDWCIKPDPAAVIDVGLAKEQHNTYQNTLEKLGLGLVTVAADERYPDCCFVEDTAIVVGELAVVLSIGAPSRVGEEVEVRKVLAEYKSLVEIDPPATMDGGDVMCIDDKLFVGLSQRTNREAVAELEKKASGYEVIAVPLEGVLHLKSACTYLGNDCILVCRGHFDESILSVYKKIYVHPEDSYSANCLTVNGKVLVSKGFPRTRSAIEAAGFETIELDMSEFRKAGGSLTCLSILF
jgi:dimethylargininase